MRKTSLDEISNLPLGRIMVATNCKDVNISLRNNLDYLFDKVKNIPIKRFVKILKPMSGFSDSYYNPIFYIFNCRDYEDDWNLRGRNYNRTYDIFRGKVYLDYKT